MKFSQISIAFNALFSLGVFFEVRAQPPPPEENGGSVSSGCLVHCPQLSNYCERSGCKNLDYVPAMFFPKGVEGEAACGEYICTENSNSEGNTFSNNLIKYPFHGLAYVPQSADPNARQVFTTAPKTAENGELSMYVTNKEVWDDDDTVSIVKVLNDESFSTVCSCYVGNINDDETYTMTDNTVTKYSLRLKLNMGTFDGPQCDFCSQKATQLRGKKLQIDRTPAGLK